MTPIPHKELSLYIHIPFCTSRCRYCNFYFETGWSPRIMDRTLRGILYELAWYVEKQTFQPHSIKTIYIGGGTPSTIPPKQFDEFLTEMFQIIQPFLEMPGLEEFCVECNPESINPELLEILQKHRVDRISLGVQTFDTDLLFLLGRRATRPVVEKAFQILKSHWPNELNLDFITGIPGQTQNQVISDLETAFQANPVHFSLYSLTVEENTPLQQATLLPFRLGGIRPTSGKIHEDLWLAGKELLEKHNYIHYEVSNFALRGRESAHNLRYWNMKPYIGLGPGAVSTLKSATGPYRRTNPDIFAYSPPSKPWNSFTPEYENPSPREWLTDYLITGTRTLQGIQRHHIEQDFVTPEGPGPWEILAQAFQPFIQKNQATETANNLCLSPETLLIQDPILLEIESNIDQYLQNNLVSLEYRTSSNGKH